MKKDLQDKVVIQLKTIQDLKNENMEKRRFIQNKRKITHRLELMYKRQKVVWKGRAYRKRNFREFDQSDQIEDNERLSSGQKSRYSRSRKRSP